MLPGLLIKSCVFGPWMQLPGINKQLLRKSFEQALQHKSQKDIGNDCSPECGQEVGQSEGQL